MPRNSPSPRPAAVPPPSPPPMSLGFVRGFIGTMQPSDFSSAYMPIVRLLPSWAGPVCSLPEVGTVMSLLPSLRFERGTTDVQASSTSGGPFTFTVPQSRIVVKVSDRSLRPDDAASAGRNHFKLARNDPQLILSGWLEPASSYKGLEEFWQAE